MKTNQKCRNTMSWAKLTAVKQQTWEKLKKTTGNEVKENDGDGILWRKRD